MTAETKLSPSARILAMTVALPALLAKHELLNSFCALTFNLHELGDHMSLQWSVAASVPASALWTREDFKRRGFPEPSYFAPTEQRDAPFYSSGFEADGFRVSIIVPCALEAQAPVSA